ncbi:MAG: S41 family peptidase [Patescibacteria group bacterium]
MEHISSTKSRTIRGATVASYLGVMLFGVLIGASATGWGSEETLKGNGRASSTATGSVIGLGQSARVDVDQDVDFKLFWELWDTMKEKYYQQPVTDKALFYGAMSGLAQSVGDPYTMFFEPVSAEAFQQQLAGKFQGIGAEIGLKNEQIQIIAPLPDTPAERAGLRAGDWIIKIDGTETVGMTVEKAVSLIRGDKGTKVTLSIYRPNVEKPSFDVTITRDDIQVRSVKTKMLASGLMVIEVTHFNGDTGTLFEQAVQEAKKKQPKGIILDLRNNPGGFLDMALEISGYWVGDQIVVKERRQGKVVETLLGTVRQPAFGKIPTVVLVNQGSASAAEIVAGALQDHGKAKLVGTKTFGKGSVQDYQSLRDGSAIKITVAEWVTPQERTINKSGLEPDIVVERTAEDYEAERDPQLDRAVGILTGAVDLSTATTTRAIPAPRP